MIRITYVSPLAALVIVLAGFAISLTNDPQKMPSALIDKATPVFTVAALRVGEAGLSSEDLKGAPSLLNVFASWCPACRAEHPFLVRLANDSGVRILGIDWKDSRQRAEQWLIEHQSPYERVAFDESGRVGIDFGVTGVPETFVIDREGRVRYRHAGPLTEQVWLMEIEPLLFHLRKTP